MNIFELKNDLLQVFDELEENGGELTPELESMLKFTQNEATSKVKEYAEVITLIKGDIALIDQEVKRLRDLKSRKTKAIENISNLIITAIEYFGETDKKGKKYIDYGTGKVTTRKSSSFIQNTDNTDGIVATLFHYLEWLRENNQLDFATDVDIDSYKEALANYKMREGEELINYPITLQKGDLENIEASINFKLPVSKLMSGKGFEFVKVLVDTIPAFIVESSIDKTSLKSKVGNELPNVGHVEEKNNLVIK